MGFQPNTLWQFGAHQVSSLWPWLAPEEFSWFRIPKESKSTCMACPKIAEERFHKINRCCTYFPRITNFHLGWALKNPDSKTFVTQLIEARKTTPEGLNATPWQLKLSLQVNHQDDFGKTHAITCPFLDRDSLACQIYENRNGTCSTFFCKTDCGEDGNEFWNAMAAYINQVEEALGQWCMKQLGNDPVEFFSRYNDIDPTKNLSEDAWSEEADRSLWSGIKDRVEFFLQCAQLVEDKIDDLFEIAKEVELQRPQKFDQKFRDNLEHSLQKEFDEISSIGGTVVPVEDLWYQLQLSQRNLVQKYGETLSLVENIR